MGGTEPAAFATIATGSAATIHIRFAAISNSVLAARARRGDTDGASLYLNPIRNIARSNGADRVLQHDLGSTRTRSRGQHKWNHQRQAREALP
jgi:hypothetical protein